MRGSREISLVPSLHTYRASTAYRRSDTCRQSQLLARWWQMISSALYTLSRPSSSTLHVATAEIKRLEAGGGPPATACLHACAQKEGSGDRYEPGRLGAALGSS